MCTRMQHSQLCTSCCFCTVSECSSILTRSCKQKGKHQTDLLPNSECIFLFYNKTLLYRMCRNSVRISDISIRNHEHIPYGGNTLKKIQVISFYIL